MPTLAKVLAVCVNWNGREVLPRTVDCLIRSEGVDLRILVIDNASRDGSADALPAPVQTLRLAENEGYAAALNAAVQAGGEGGPAWRPDYYLFLNNDVFFDSATISNLTAFAEREGPGVFGPKILLEACPDRLEAAWGEVSWGHVLARYHGKMASAEEPRWNRVQRVKLLLGCFFMAHRRVVHEVGPFDQRFFMYHEEVDFLYRADRLGFPIYYCPFARVVHRSGHASRRLPRKKAYWLRRNAVLFLKKHQAGAGKWMKFGATLLLSLGWNLARLQVGRAAAIWRGARDGFRERTGHA